MIGRTSLAMQDVNSLMLTSLEASKYGFGIQPSRFGCHVKIVPAKQLRILVEYNYQTFIGPTYKAKYYAGKQSE